MSRQQPPSRSSGLTPPAVQAAAGPSRKKKSRPNGGAGSRRHYVVSTLGLPSDQALLDALPPHVKDRFHDVCWVPWKASGSSSVPSPALILNPFDLGGKSEMLDAWIRMFRRCTEETEHVGRRRAGEDASSSRWQVLVYFYEKGYSESKDFKAFALVDSSAIVDYEEGLRRGFDRPEDVLAKREAGEKLTRREEELLEGIERIKVDAGLTKPERGGEMFFEDLRNKKRAMVEELARARASEPISRAGDGGDARAEAETVAVGGKGQDGMCRCHRCCTEGGESGVNNLPSFDFEVYWVRAGSWWICDRWTHFHTFEYTDETQGTCIVDWGDYRGWKEVEAKWRKKSEESAPADESNSIIEGPLELGICTNPVYIRGNWPDEEDRWQLLDNIRWHFWEDAAEEGQGGPCRVEWIGGKKWKGKIVSAEWKEMKREHRKNAVTNVPKPKPTNYFHSDKASLEICSGEAGMSRALGKQGFDAKTLDFDKKKNAHSRLSLEELEGKINDGSIRNHPFLNDSYDVIWAAPDCKTWSIASNGYYRNTESIDGFPQYHHRYADAQQAKKDIQSLVSILQYYKRKNSNLLICVENPDGYLEKHPVSDQFTDPGHLNLTLVKVSQCFFRSTEENTQATPQKGTVIWTNSRKLIETFGDKSFICRNDCTCMEKKGKKRKHQVGAQDLSDRGAAYPLEMCNMMAMLLAADARNLNRLRNEKSQENR